MLLGKGCLRSIGVAYTAGEKAHVCPVKDVCVTHLGDTGNPSATVDINEKRLLFILVFFKAEGVDILLFLFAVGDFFAVDNIFGNSFACDYVGKGFGKIVPGLCNKTSVVDFFIHNFLPRVNVFLFKV